MNLAVSPPLESVNLWIDSLSVVVPKNSVFILSVLTLKVISLYRLNEFLFKSEKMLMKGFIDNLSGLNKLADYHPSKIIGTTTDVLDAAIYLANGDKFVNGMEIRLDGGISSRLHDPN